MLHWLVKQSQNQGFAQVEALVQCDGGGPQPPAASPSAPSPDKQKKISLLMKAPDTNYSCIERHLHYIVQMSQPCPNPKNML